MDAKIGIDPGITGALSLLVDDTCSEIVDMPIMAKVSGRGNQVNARELYSIINDWSKNYNVKSVYVERVSSMPGQGVSSVFSFGKSAGIIEGVLAAFEFKVFFPTPQSWKKRAGIIGKDKDHSRTLAINEFPEMAGQLSRKKDVGRADSILIARYGE